MDDEAKLNTFLAILAYSGGSYTTDQVKDLYVFIKNECSGRVPAAMSVVKPVDGKISH